VREEEEDDVRDPTVSLNVRERGSPPSFMGQPIRGVLVLLFSEKDK
jgi:hypothetical protein